MANQQQTVYLYASRVHADHCAFRVIILPTFSQMCPCLLLVGANVTLGGAHLIRLQYIYANPDTSSLSRTHLAQYFPCL